MKAPHTPERALALVRTLQTRLSRRLGRKTSLALCREAFADGFGCPTWHDFTARLRADASSLRWDRARTVRRLGLPAGTTSAAIADMETAASPDLTARLLAGREVRSLRLAGWLPLLPDFADTEGFRRMRDATVTDARKRPLYVSKAAAAATLDTPDRREPLEARLRDLLSDLDDPAWPAIVLAGAANFVALKRIAMDWEASQDGVNSDEGRETAPDFTSRNPASLSAHLMRWSPESVDRFATCTLVGLALNFADALWGASAGSSRIGLQSDPLGEPSIQVAWPGGISMPDEEVATLAAIETSGFPGQVHFQSLGAADVVHVYGERKGRLVLKDASPSHSPTLATDVVALGMLDEWEGSDGRVLTLGTVAIQREILPSDHPGEFRYRLGVVRLDSADPALREQCLDLATAACMSLVLKDIRACVEAAVPVQGLVRVSLNGMRRRDADIVAMMFQALAMHLEEESEYDDTGVSYTLEVCPRDEEVPRARLKAPPAPQGAVSLGTVWHAGRVLSLAAKADDCPVLVTVHGDGRATEIRLQEDEALPAEGPGVTEAIGLLSSDAFRRWALAVLPEAEGRFSSVLLALTRRCVLAMDPRAWDDPTRFAEHFHGGLAVLLSEDVGRRETVLKSNALWQELHQLRRFLVEAPEAPRGSLH